MSIADHPRDRTSSAIAWTCPARRVGSPTRWSISSPSQRPFRSRDGRSHRQAIEVRARHRRMRLVGREGHLTCVGSVGTIRELISVITRRRPPPGSAHPRHEVGRHDVGRCRRLVGGHNQQRANDHAGRMLATRRRAMIMCWPPPSPARASRCCRGALPCARSSIACLAAL